MEISPPASTSALLIPFFRRSWRQRSAVYPWAIPPRSSRVPGWIILACCRELSWMHVCPTVFSRVFICKESGSSFIDRAFLHNLVSAPTEISKAPEEAWVKKLAW